jgi:ankyrin repeat protein
MNAGADVNAKTEKGVTALMIAAAKGHVDVLKVLSQCPTKELWHQVYNTTTN